MNQAKLMLTVVAALLGVLSVTGSAAAEGHKRGGGLFGSEMHQARMARMLDLSDEQRTQMQSIIDGARAEARRIAEGMVASHGQLREVVRSGTFDETKVSELAAAQGELMADKIVLKTRVRMQIQSILNPEQRERMEEMHAKRRKHGSGS